jgi:hypothetical protein
MRMTRLVLIIHGKKASAPTLTRPRHMWVLVP